MQCNMKNKKLVKPLNNWVIIFLNFISFFYVVHYKYILSEIF